MSYRPITDTWILARSKVKYYGAYPAGFLERARALLGVTMQDPVLHVCAGRVDKYPFRGGFGKNDYRLDADPAMQADFIVDVNDATRFPRNPESLKGHWPAILMDPPYTQEDHEHYDAAGQVALPNPHALLALALQRVRPGGRVGMLHYILPRPPKIPETKFIACVTVVVGFGNRLRCYSVFERRA